MRFIDLRKLKRALETMASQCNGGTLTLCRIIDALFDPRAGSSRPHEGEVDDESRNLAKGYFELAREAARIGSTKWQQAVAQRRLSNAP